MLFMLNRMTVWTKNFKVLHFIVFIISIFVMYSKYLFMFRKTTPGAFIYKTSNIHHFPNAFWSFWAPFKMIPFLNTFHATVFSFMSVVTNKFFITKKASIFSISFIFERLVIAFPRTIPCRFFSKENNIKFRITNLASNIYALVLGFVTKRTRPRTEFKCGFPVFGNHYSFVTIQATARCSHAIIQG